VSTFLFIGYHFGARWEEILRVIEHNLKEASVVATCLIVAYAVFVYVRRRRPANS
jgi:membrane protein DedA with SNARE-associated domain